MKKILAKIASALLAVVMVLGMAVPAFAEGETSIKNDSITINNAVKDETYKLYKMLDLSVDSETNPTAYKYTVNSAWTDFFTTGAGKDYVTIDTTDGHVTWKEGKQDADSMATFGKAAAAYATSNNIAETQTQKAEGTTVTFSGLEDGYYLVTSTLGTVAMTETTPASSKVTINEKNPTDTIEKTVKEDSTGEYGKSNDAEVGQLVEFKSVATLEPNTRNVYIHDTMSDGLTFTTGSIKIYTDSALTTELAVANYEIVDPAQNGDTFTIHFTDDYINSLTAETKLYLTYTATLNENAIVTDENGTVIKDQNNKTKITYGDSQSVEDQTVTTTHKFSVYCL